MNKIFIITKYALLVLLPCVLCLSMMGMYAAPSQLIFTWMFYIALSGFVGISTNTIAIRMLFRPKKPTFFRRQGLIPKNKTAIAQKIAEETEKRLLNIETIMHHIDRGRIIEQIINTLSQTIEDYLSKKENRRKIADTVLAYYNEYADRIFQWLTRAAETWLTEFTNQNVTVDNVWAVMKPKIKSFFESEDLKHKTSTWIITSIGERAPELSRLVMHLVEEYIEEHVWWKKNLLKAIKQFAGLQKETVARFVREAVYSPETYRQVVGFVEDNLENVEQYLEREEVKTKIETLLFRIKTYLVDTSREKAIPALRKKIDSILTTDEAWEVMDRQLVRLLNKVPGTVHNYLQRRENIQKIRSAVPDIVEKLNLKQIIKENIEGQDTEEFEQMIMKVTGENIAAIEVLGGLLGMLAGVALMKPVFLVLLPVGISGFLLVEYLLLKIKSCFMRQ